MPNLMTVSTNPGNVAFGVTPGGRGKAPEGLDGESYSCLAIEYRSYGLGGDMIRDVVTLCRQCSADGFIFDEDSRGVHGSGFSDEGFSQVVFQLGEACWDNLKVLKLKNMQLTLKDVSPPRNLRIFEVDTCKNIDLGALRRFSASSKLEELRLYGIDGDVDIQLGPCVTKLDIRRCSMSKDSLMRIMSSARSVMDLEILVFDCPNIQLTAREIKQEYEGKVMHLAKMLGLLTRGKGRLIE